MPRRQRSARHTPHGARSAGNRRCDRPGLL